MTLTKMGIRNERPEGDRKSDEYESALMAEHENLSTLITECAQQKQQLQEAKYALELRLVQRQQDFDDAELTMLVETTAMQIHGCEDADTPKVIPGA